MLGNKLRAHPDNMIYHFNLDTLYKKMMSNGKYAHIHVYLFKLLLSGETI